MLKTLPTSFRIKVLIGAQETPCDLAPLFLLPSFPPHPSHTLLRPRQPLSVPRTYEVHVYLRAFAPAVTTLFPLDFCMASSLPSLRSLLRCHLTILPTFPIMPPSSCSFTPGTDRIICRLITSVPWRRSAHENQALFCSLLCLYQQR